jgi:hypothetical protein
MLRKTEGCGEGVREGGERERAFVDTSSAITGHVKDGWDWKTSMLYQVRNRERGRERGCRGGRKRVRDREGGCKGGERESICGHICCHRSCEGLMGWEDNALSGEKEGEGVERGCRGGRKRVRDGEGGSKGGEREYSWIHFLLSRALWMGLEDINALSAVCE